MDPHDHPAGPEISRIRQESEAGGKATPEEISRAAGLPSPEGQGAGADLERALADTKALLPDSGEAPEMAWFAVFDQHGRFHGRTHCYDEGEAIGTVMDHAEGDQRGLNFHAIEFPFEVESRSPEDVRADRSSALSFTASDMINFAHRVSAYGASVDRGFSEDQIVRHLEKYRTPKDAAR